MYMPDKGGGTIMPHALSTNSTKMADICILVGLLCYDLIQKYVRRIFNSCSYTADYSRIKEVT